MTAKKKTKSVPQDNLHVDKAKLSELPLGFGHLTLPPAPPVVKHNTFTVNHHTTPDGHVSFNFCYNGHGNKE